MAVPNGELLCQHLFQRGDSNFPIYFPELNLSPCNFIYAGIASHIAELSFKTVPISPCYNWLLWLKSLTFFGLKSNLLLRYCSCIDREVFWHICSYFVNDKCFYQVLKIIPILTNCLILLVKYIWVHPYTTGLNILLTFNVNGMYTILITSDRYYFKCRSMYIYISFCFILFINEGEQSPIF